MEIKSFKLKNFRQFKNVDLEFSQDTEKPFTIITGGNTYGKTTLVKSFLWCMYGQKLFDDKNLLNKEVFDAMKIGDVQEVKAVLELDHNQFSYKITTRETYLKLPSGDLKIQEKTNTTVLKIGDGGNSIPLKTDAQIKEEIESILSPELSPYFFFDGETNSIEKITKRGNLTNAVSEIMGLKKVELLVDYFNPHSGDNVVKRFQAKLETNDPILAQSLHEKLEEKQEERENKLEYVKSIDEAINALEEQLAEKEKELDENQDILKDQEEKKEIVDEMEDLIDDKNSEFSSMMSLMWNRSYILNSLFAYSFEKNNLQELLNETAFLTEKSVSHITEEAIDELIARGYCLCGAKIETHNDAYNHLIEQKDYVEPRNYGKHIESFIDNENTNINYSPNNMDTLSEKAGDIIDIIVDLDDYQKRLDTIIKRIEGKPDIGIVQTAIKNMEYQKNTKEGERNYILNTVIPNLDSKIEELNERIKKLSSVSEKNKFVEECIKYAEKIYQMASKKITSEKERIRKELELTVGTIFNEMYTGNRRIVINDKFQVSTTLVDSSKMDTSKGLETVMNFSFVAGLMQLIKEKINNDDDDFEQEHTDDNYPLVMDAPFSNTDEQHITNICLNLPKYCNQIIIVVMDKDYNMASNKITAKVGKKYVIKKESETFATIEEEI